MKSMKKAFAFLLSLTLIVGIFSNTGVGFTAKAATTENLVTVFYKNSDWSGVPNIHYKVGSTWTDVPGVPMTKSSEQSGYKYKYVISLGSHSKATVCFNDGKGHWDSCNGQN